MCPTVLPRSFHRSCGHDNGQGTLGPMATRDGPNQKGPPRIGHGVKRPRGSKPWESVRITVVPAAIRFIASGDTMSTWPTVGVSV